MPRISDRSSLDTRIGKLRTKAEGHYRDANWANTQSESRSMGGRHMQRGLALDMKADKMRDTHAIAKKAAETRKRNGMLGAGAAHVHKSRG